MRRGRLLKGLLSMGYTSLVVVVVQLATVPVLANSWGLALYGQWLLLSTVPSFLAAGDFGFGAAAGARLIGDVARGELDEARQTFQSALAVVLGFSVATLAVIVTVAAVLPGRLLGESGGMDSGTSRAVLMILCVYGVLSVQAVLFTFAIRAHGGFAVSATLQATVLLAEGLAVIAVALWGGPPLHAALALLSVRALGVAGQILLARRRAAWLKVGFGQASRSRVSELTGPALAAMVMPISRAGFLQGSVIAVGAAAGAASVPIFTSLRTLARVGLFVMLAVNKPIFPEFTSELARGNTAWIRKVTGAMMTMNALVGVVAAATLALLGNSILSWWTRGAISAPNVMLLLTAAAILAGAIWEPASALLLAVNRHTGFSYLLAIGAGSAVGLTYLFVRQWGITGAAAANLLFELAMLGAVFLPLRRIAGSFPVGLATLGAVMPRRRRSE
jgi:O-antigen/teichoic acid export membrane protein